jgi:hypothetical protein
MGTLVVGEGSTEKIEQPELVEAIYTEEAKVEIDYSALIKELESKVSSDLTLIYKELTGFRDNVVQDLNTIVKEIEKDRAVATQINEDLNVQKLCQIEGQTQYGQLCEQLKELDARLVGHDHQLQPPPEKQVEIVTKETVVEKVPKLVYGWLSVLSLILLLTIAFK